MGSYVVCQQCKGHEPIKEKSKMEVEVLLFEESGRKKNLYFHKECYPLRLKKKEDNEKERIEKDGLDVTLRDIYVIRKESFVPPNIWSILTDIRNGTIRGKKGEKLKKKYKEGVPYYIIREAYLLARQDIEWARLSKHFKTTELEMRYGLRIITSRIDDAFKKIRKTEQSEKMAEAMDKVRIANISDEREVVYKSKKLKDDMSGILGDD